MSTSLYLYLSECSTIYLKPALHSKRDDGVKVITITKHSHTYKETKSSRFKIMTNDFNRTKRSQNDHKIPLGWLLWTSNFLCNLFYQVNLARFSRFQYINHLAEYTISAKQYFWVNKEKRCYFHVLTYFSLLT